ncbi:hypothetical protein [Cellulophaga sp. E6(2014)]|uniref:hypothetical protein n=1 Tax=Cellulophaga sp. E6(2014) TaxID=1495334 RepID=UPI00051DCE60|nr:hypothetical protein [Cellulophaga sp. E6(2014)]KGK29407.1 hypothetical protein EL45_15925 [Cellulophaga sp. E6(2014)]
MKYKITFTLILLYNLVLSQNLSPAPNSEAGMLANAKGGSPMLNLVMMELRNNESNNAVNKTLGTPYSNDKFIKSKIYYDNDLQGEFFVRYNALNSSVEIKKSQQSEEKPQQLLADKKITIKYLDKELRFTTYINKKKKTKNGYLSLIVDGENYQLYHKLAVKYSEGKTAANSMVASIPNKYTHFEEYYYHKKELNHIDYLPLRKGNFLKQFSKINKEKIKEFISKNSLSTTKEKDLIAIFNYINKL